MYTLYRCVLVNSPISVSHDMVHLYRDALMAGSSNMYVCVCLRYMYIQLCTCAHGLYVVSPEDVAPIVSV